MNGKKANQSTEWLTIEEINLIKMSCAQVEDAIEMASDFYNRLFYLYPVIRPLFKENIHQQACEFTKHVFNHAKDIKNWEDIQHGIMAFRQRYVLNEVNPQLYIYMGEALFYALKNQLRKSWNAQLESTWLKFYGIIINQLGTTLYNNVDSPHIRQLPLAS